MPRDSACRFLQLDKGVLSVARDLEYMPIGLGLLVDREVNWRDNCSPCAPLAAPNRISGLLRHSFAKQLQQVCAVPVEGEWNVLAPRINSRSRCLEPINSLRSLGPRNDVRPNRRSSKMPKWFAWTVLSTVWTASPALAGICHAPAGLNLQQWFSVCGPVVQEDYATRGDSWHVISELCRDDLSGLPPIRTAAMGSPPPGVVGNAGMLCLLVIPMLQWLDRTCQRWQQADHGG